MLEEILILFLLLACILICFLFTFVGFWIGIRFTIPKKEKTPVLSAEDETAKKKMEKELKNFLEYTGDQQ